MSEVKYVYPTWSQIDEYCDNIVEQIKKSGKSFNVIISIGRGGLIPSRILSDRLSISDIYLYSIKLYKGINQRNQIPTIRNFNDNIQGRSVLIIDDIMDSGRTIETVYHELQSRIPKSLYTATLFCKEHVIRKPTYFVIESYDNEWICFPWEVREFGKEKK